MDPDARIALLVHGHLVELAGKMASGMLRYADEKVCAVIDRDHAGRAVMDVMPIRSDTPVVASVRKAAALGADTLLVGVAPPGGRLPDGWRNEILEALDAGMSLVNPLHDRWEADEELRARLKPGRYIWDVRAEPPNLQLATGEAERLSVPRVLTVGTDMGSGKMTAALELVRAAERQGRRVGFVATGQVGICISGWGVAIDAVRVDFAAGAVEAAVVRAAQDADLVLIEGQGGLPHPAATANLALLRGAMPTHLLMVHRAGQTAIRTQPWARVPPLKPLIRLYEDLAECCGCFRRPQTIGVALNTSNLSDEDAGEAVRSVESETGLPVTDPVRFGCGPLVAALEADLSARAK
ncbi:MAG: DUF1611 domain-containing protein [Armatimonadetes bacterium]|nr:DUF1611 domain-containing protein [Armatimonadota bacterium]